MTANEGNKVPALGTFPWEKLLEGEDTGRSLIVDVGGGEYSVLIVRRINC